MTDLDQWNGSLVPEGTLIWDRTDQLDERDVLYSFALEELLCRQTGEGGPPLLHMWRHPRGFVMGLRDSRLPGAPEAQRWLERQGYSVAVRNSGGAAVPLDLGVVNVSLILPKRRQGDVHFHDDFERMYRLLNATLAAAGSEAHKGEIEGAYCPGDYDLSIGGRKFCGIAQRRQANAYVVQAFVVIAGSGEERAELARAFYRIAAAGTAATADGAAAAPGQSGTAHPEVTTEHTASLEQLGVYAAGTGVPLFVDAVKRIVREGAGTCGTGGDNASHGSFAASLKLPDRHEVLAMADSLRNRYGIKRGML